MVTLRGERMWSFLDRLMNIALPRVRDFRGVSPDSFDGRGNYTLGFREQLVFPEIEYDKIDIVVMMRERTRFPRAVIEALPKLKLLITTGAYNASNVLGAIATALAAGVPFAAIQAATPRYLGLENRFTLVDAAGVEVVKDYISHPTGIKRVLEAARAQAEGPVVAVFKPYRFTMIHYLQDDYREAFRDADRVLVTELYTAGEVPIPGIDTDFLCNKIREVVPDVSYVHALDDIPPWLAREVTAPATVLFFGGDDLFRTADAYVALRRG